MKLVSRDREWSFEYERFRLSPQPAYYFEEPPGYKKRLSCFCAARMRARKTMSGLLMRSRSSRWNLLAAVAVAWFYLWSGAGQLLLAAGTISSVPKDTQEAFDKQQYEQVLEQLAKLEKEQSAAPEFAG